MTASVVELPIQRSAFYRDSYSHLDDELRFLNHLLEIRVAAVRRDWEGRPQSAGQQLYISHEEVDWLLREAQARGDAAGDRHAGRDVLRTLRDQIDASVAESVRRGVVLALPRLAHLFGLSVFEVQVVLVCLAPELRRGYDRIYAYLQDDITRQRPTVDLALDLLCDSEMDKWAARSAFDAQAPLRRREILQTIDDPHSPSGSSGLARFLKLDPRILQFILGNPSLDVRLNGVVHLDDPSQGREDPGIERVLATSLASFARRHFSNDVALPRVLVHLHGPKGVGKRDLAFAVCRALNRALLVLDVQRLPVGEAEADSVLRVALRESLLLQVPLYLAPADLLLQDGDRTATLRQILARAIEAYGGFIFLAGERPWPYPSLFEGVLFYSASLAMPDEGGREAAWIAALRNLGRDEAVKGIASRLAGRFRLTPQHIRDAVTSVADRRTVEGNVERLTFETLAAASRAQADHELGALATKIDPRPKWIDLVLSDDTLEQLRDICSQARHYYDVYERWGFGSKITRGRGISALFSGPPGTGKTMAAEVIAGDLEIDLYKVDLARMVSKYIGETEKNLSRVFSEAENSNAILFFDEADALFGKRTQISDAHDRYANIETSYLLQRMEDYDGIVILASNLRENMDDAFLRRIRFIVEFPFPDAANRLKIWRAHLPPQAPIDAVIDFARLADEIKVAGGSIKNIVLNAAFFAAADGGIIKTAHLLRSARREFEKIGKLWDERTLTRGAES